MTSKTPTQRLMACKTFRLEYGMSRTVKDTRIREDFEIDFKDRRTQALLVMQLVELGQKSDPLVLGLGLRYDHAKKPYLDGAVLENAGQVDSCTSRFKSFAKETIGEVFADAFEGLERTIAL